MNWLDFEIYVGDLLEENGIKTTEELMSFSDDIHNRVEVAIADYAIDFGIEDYIPLY